MCSNWFLLLEESVFEYCVEALPFIDILLLNVKTFNALCQLRNFFLGRGTAHAIGVHTVTKCKLKGVSVTHVHDVFNLNTLMVSESDLRSTYPKRNGKVGPPYVIHACQIVRFAYGFLECSGRPRTFLTHLS